MIKNVVRFIFIGVSLGLLIIFLLPIRVKIFNMGNLAGILVSGFLAAVLIFPNFFVSVLKSVLNMEGGRVFVALVAIFTVLSVVYAMRVSVLMVRTMDDAPRGRETTLVVLGCKVKDGSPSLMLKKRLDTAFDYLQSHKSTKVVVSGGQGSDEIISEAECMKNYLISRGLSPDRIFMEDKSVSTKQNLEFSKEVIFENSLAEHITIVTDGFHQLRAEMIANHFGMSAYNISAPTSWWLVPTYWVREWFGVFHYKALETISERVRDTGEKFPDPSYGGGKILEENDKGKGDLSEK